MTWRSRIKFILLFILITDSAKGFEKSHRQFFRKKPRDRSIAEGQSVILPCEVGNRSGSVQWTRDGLTLGFDRSLPGFSRYSITGHDGNGEYNLKITNATLDDDAVFECQVGPAPNNSPIRAQAKLNVLFPPKRIEIAGIEMGSKLTARENEEVELKCIVFDAKPKATIVWYRENSKFFTESRIDENVIGDENASSARLSTLANNQRITSISTIRFRPSDRDNQVTWACEAQHPALKNSPMRASVFLSVQHPPGRPEITGYMEGETIRLAQTVTLICSSRGGYPLADIVWYKNGIMMDKSYTSSGRESRNAYTFVADTEDNDAKFRCEASNEFSPEPLSAEIVLSVQFAPSKVELNGPTEARVNEIIEYQCSTSNSNPPASIQWVVDNSTLDSSSPGYKTKTLPSPRGGWITLSNISVKIEHHKKNKMISCQALNPELNDVKTNSSMLSIIYPPGTPTIQGLSYDDILTVGKLKRVKCTSLAGNPSPSLRWYRGTELLQSRTVFSDNFASAELEFTPTRRDNGGDLRCEALNSALRLPVYASQNLTVEFPPNFVKIDIKPQFPVSGEDAYISCESGSSNPASAISWWRDGERIVEGIVDSEFAGDFGGKRTRSELRLKVSGVEHDGAVIRCRASNNVDYVDDATTLSVAHQPTFVNGDSSPIKAVEGSGAIINMTAKANPPVLTYKWSLNLEENRSRDGFVIQDGVLKIRSVQRSHAGMYTVSATNDRGSATHTFEIDVLYSPKIVYITKSALVGEGESALFECAVDANPFTETTIRWVRDDYDMEGRTKTTPGSVVIRNGTGTNVGTVLLTVLNSTASDSGAFRCEADNGIGEGGQPISNETFLLVRHKPTIIQTPMTLKAAANPGETGVLICEAKGVPNVTISWIRSSAAFENKEKYEIVQTLEDPLTWKSEFYIRNVEIKDYGTYECVARNIEGTTRQKILFDVKTRPDMPTKVHVDNISHESVHLFWEPGFDGGSDQHFRIRFSSAEYGYEYRDVYPANTNHFLVNKLHSGIEYAFSIMAFNNQGESNYTDNSVIVRTSIDYGNKDSALPAQPVNENVFGSDSDRRTGGEMSSSTIFLLSFVGLILLAVLVFAPVYHRLRKTRSREPFARKIIGSTSGGSTKSGTIELYTTSSYNETNSGGGETLSSISEKSCVSSNIAMPPPRINQNKFQSHHLLHHHSHHHPVFLEDGLHPNSQSTYILDTPPLRTTPVQSRGGSLRRPPTGTPPIYSVVNKPSRAPSSGQSDYENTESEYASEIRNKAIFQTIGDQTVYGRSVGGSMGGGCYSTLLRPTGQSPRLICPPHVVSCNNNKNVAEPQIPYQDLPSYPPTGAPVIETSNDNEGPLCASSPKRTPLTTFGQTESVPTSSNGPLPTMGHLV